MNELGHVSKGKLLLDKILQKRSEAELLENNFYVVAEIPNLLRNKDQISAPSYRVRTINITIQFKSIQSKTNCPFLKDNLVLLAGDPTGTIEVIFSPKSLKNINISISKLLCGVFSLLNVGLIVIQSRIYLIVLGDTKFLKCVSFLDNLNNSELSKTLKEFETSFTSGSSSDNSTNSKLDSHSTADQSSDSNKDRLNFVNTNNNITKSYRVALV